MSFGKLRPRREQGLSAFSGYKWAWSGAHWQPLLASGSSLEKATRDGIALTIAADQPNAPGIFELAIAHKEKPRSRVPVYVGAGESLRDELSALLADGGEVRGFLDHALKTNHVLWVRCKRKATPEAAVAARDAALADYDFAWIQQNGARARSLVLKPRRGCCVCCCCCKAKRTQLTEGPPKFVAEKQKSGLSQMLSSKKR